jgi:hypothetical protein
MTYLTSQEALQLAADFALKAEYMRNDDAADSRVKADLYETASRVATMRAQMSAKGEQARPLLGINHRRATLVVA